MVEKNKSQDEAAIKQMILEWKEAVLHRDISRLLSFIADDAVFMPPGQPLIRGKAEVEAMYKTAFEKFHMEQDFEVEEIQIAGDFAFFWGVDSAQLIPMEGGLTVNARGMGISILKRQSDGSWKFYRGINNMTRQELT
jgi:uncharacterized protein (TIGR02246 family)